MQFPFPGIGVVFDIEGLGRGFYGHQAWSLFMRHIRPQRIAASVLLEGDTTLTLAGSADEFCIAVYGFIELEYIRATFGDVTEPGLAAHHRRFIEKSALDSQPLAPRGRIDAFGRLITERWDGGDHKLCKETGWAYSPEQIPASLDPKLRIELEGLKRPRDL